MSKLHFTNSVAPSNKQHYFVKHTCAVLVDDVPCLHHKALHHTCEGHTHVAQLAISHFNAFAERQEVFYSLQEDGQVERVGGQYCRVTNCVASCLGRGGNGAVTRLARQLKACRLCSVIPGGSRQNGRQCANTPTAETGRTATPSDMC